MGENWKTLPPIEKDLEKVKLLRSQVMKLVKGGYKEIFVALNRYYKCYYRT